MSVSMILMTGLFYSDNENSQLPERFFYKNYYVIIKTLHYLNLLFSIVKSFFFKRRTKGNPQNEANPDIIKEV